MADKSDASGKKDDGQDTPDASEEEPEEHNREDRSGLLKIISKANLLDITTIAIPVTYNEPLCFIQRMCEYLQYWELIEKANAAEDPDVRTLFVAVFAITCFSCSDRMAKPFNPLLGETYEYVDESRSYQFVAEQVCHHPPVGASHATSASATFWQTQEIKTKFAAPNGLECRPIGLSHIKLKNSKDHFVWENLQTMVHNLIIGKTWLDHYGDVAVQCKGSKRRAQITFKQCGWFGRGWHDVVGTVYDENDNARFSLSGKWNDAIYVTQLHEGYNDLSKKAKKAIVKQAHKERKKDKKEKVKKNKKSAENSEDVIPVSVNEDDFVFEMGKPKLIWSHYYKNRVEPGRLGDKWYLTEHTCKIIHLTDEMREILPPTDSRLRPDRIALENGENKKAANEKYKLEEAQRALRKQREAKGIEYKPTYFTKTEESGEWVFNGTYWKEREERIDKYKAKKKSEEKQKT